MGKAGAGDREDTGGYRGAEDRPGTSASGWIGLLRSSGRALRDRSHAHLAASAVLPQAIWASSLAMRMML